MPSKHQAAKSLVGRGLYDNLNTFTELEQRIGALGDENTKAVGDALEIFVEAFLATQPIMQCDEGWIVGQVPLDVRRVLNLPADTKGIDGVFRSRTGRLVPYQVKCRSNRAYLTFAELAPFLGLTERASEERIVFTNARELATDVLNRTGLRAVRGIDFDRMTIEDFTLIEAWLKEHPVTHSPRFPALHQQEALAAVGQCLQTHDRAHLVMAC